MEIGIVLGILGLLGLIPVIADRKKYIEQIEFALTKAQLRIEYLHISYDVVSISDVKVRYTGKYRVLKDSPLLEMPFRNIFGDVNGIQARIGNQMLCIDIIQDGEEIKGQCRLTDKSKGDTFVLDLEATLSAEVDKTNTKDDGLGFWLNYYRCRQLQLQVLFPRGVYPENVRFVEGDSNFKSKKKEKFGMMRIPTLCGPDRRQLQWLINYPRYDKGYWIRWSWNMPGGNPLNPPVDAPAAAVPHAGPRQL